MEIIGLIDKIINKSKPPFKKQLVVVSDVMNDENKWGIEFRKQLAEAAKALRPGDYIKINLSQ